MKSAYKKMIKKRLYLRNQTGKLFPEEKKMRFMVTFESSNFQWFFDAEIKIWGRGAF